MKHQKSVKTVIFLLGMSLLIGTGNAQTAESNLIQGMLIARPSVEATIGPDGMPDHVGMSAVRLCGSYTFSMSFDGENEAKVNGSLELYDPYQFVESSVIITILQSTVDSSLWIEKSFHNFVPFGQLNYAFTYALQTKVAPSIQLSNFRVYVIGEGLNRQECFPTAEFSSDTTPGLH